MIIAVFQETLILAFYAAMLLASHIVVTKRKYILVAL